ncbi:hypothetical protein [Nonlabens xiamenensis]|uniref:hypothetical protein n=1 Tax=Nonlabens xiamenensis TaxID=2341043 RepID=UPI000F60625E|nr:hypothetical protein [Nonlabens xiamenensis]
MKFVKSLLVLLVIFMTISCSSDDDATAQEQFELNTTNFAGTYQLTSYERNIRETETFNGANVTADISITGDTFTNAQYTFNQNGSFSTSGSYRETKVTRVSGNDPQTESTIINLDSNGSYILNDETSGITITNAAEGGISSGRVTNFTENGFIIMLDESRVDGDSSYESETILRFER